jgi:hypothetical protein
MLRAANLLLVFVIACGGTGTSNHASSPPPDKEFTARLPTAAFLDQLDDRERREQMRDWAVLATLAHEGATPEQTAAATYEMPAARLPYLDELYTFTYGRGRRAYFGDRLLLFVDADDPDREATIGRLADQARMELGEVPPRAEIYVVEDQRNTGTLHITHAADLEGKRLFSADYGYVEASVADASQLTAWLSEIDDLSRVRIEPNKLVLGGRRFRVSRTEGVTLDDVAALYQAAGRIHDRQDDVKSELNDLDAKYQEEFWRRMAALGYFKDHGYTRTELAQAEQAQKRINAELKREAETEVKTIAMRDHGPRAPGFSLDPHWLPAPDEAHPLMLVRLQQLAKDPCGEIARIGLLGPKLLKAEPDESRRSGETWAANHLATTKNSAPTCTWLRGFVDEQIDSMMTALEAASPEEWRKGFSTYYQFQNGLRTTLTHLTGAQRNAVVGVLNVLDFYDFETGAQCARYDETGGTAVGMTLFYTDLLAKLWESVDYGHSAPLRTVPGFLTSPRVNVSPAFADELNRLPYTRIWFGPRTDGLSRSTGDSATELAFVHRFSRVYAAGSDPAKPGKESTPNEPSRLSIGWWDRHFDEIADYEQQYHRQNQIMKWSAAVAAILEAPEAPAFLASVDVDRTARFFPWLTAHRAQLRFQEPVPERRTRYNTECVALFHSYPFESAGAVKIITGGVSLAGREAMEITPTVNLKLPPGQRVVAAANSEALPLRKLEGRTVSISNENIARVRSQTGPLNLNGVAAQFEGRAGAPAITVNSKAGKVATVTIEPIDGGVRIEMRAGPVEHVRAALDRPGKEPVISFADRPERIVQRGDTLVELKRVNVAPPDDSVTAVAHDTFGPGWRQARAADANEVIRQMDAYEWQVIKPGADATTPTSVHFRNEPPPAAAREVPVRGLEGITTARVTGDGEMFFARPVKPDQRASWHGLSSRAEVDGAFRAPSQKTIDLSPQLAAEPQGLTTDQLARRGRLEEAAALSERTMPVNATTLEGRTRAALYDIGTRNATAAKLELEALATRGQEVSEETRTLLVESLRNHGEADVAGFLDARLQGKPTPVEASLIADRGRISVKYQARHIDTVEVGDTSVEIFPPITYFDRRLLVGQEGFEPDFSGSITRWMHDPGLTVREMKTKPFDLAPGVIENTETKQQFLRARDPEASKFHNLPLGMHRVFVIEPRQSSDQRCDRARPKDAQNCADQRCDHSKPTNAQNCADER